LLWPTRWPASSGPCWSKAAPTELRPRQPRLTTIARTRGRAEGEYGATVGETGLGQPGLSTVLRARYG
jgi:hypothetical protein